MLDLDQTKAMFDAVKQSHGGSSDDQNLIDHLDVDSAFKLDLGGHPTFRTEDNALSRPRVNRTVGEGISFSCLFSLLVLRESSSIASAIALQPFAASQGGAGAAGIGRRKDRQ